MESVLSSPAPIPVSKKLLWTGRVLSGLAIAFLLMDGAMKLVPIQAVVEASARLGWPVELARSLGVLLCTCTVLYAIPRTRVLGAILLTGYLGGAVATHVRIGDPFWFPPLMGVILWAGLYLREPRLKALLSR